MPTPRKAKMSALVENARLWPSTLSSRRARILIVVVTFVLSLVYELWRALPLGLDTQFFGVPATTSVPKLLPILGGSDAGSYLGAAQDLQDGSISSKNLWVLNLWPPGMPYLLATMIKLGGGASPVVFMVVLLCVLWSIVLATLAVLLIPRGGYITLAVFALFWLVSPIFTAWTIQGGVLGSDGLATSLGTLVAIGLIWATIAPQARRPRWILYGALGIGLAALAYLRIMWFYAVPAALVGLAILAAARIIVLLIRKRRMQLLSERRKYVEWAALAATFIALCMPWTVYGATTLHPGSISWSQGDYQWGQEWMPDSYLDSIGAGFLIAGGANWPCHIAPSQCDILAKHELATAAPYSGQAPYTFTYFEHASIKAAVQNPVAFVANRSDFTIGAWLSSPGTSVGTFNNVGFGVLSLVAFLAALAVLVWQSIEQRAVPVFLLLILGANIGVVWLTHFETRYVVPLQAMSLVVLAFAIVRFERERWRKLPLRRRLPKAQSSVRESVKQEADLPAG